MLNAKVLSITVLQNILHFFSGFPLSAKMYCPEGWGTPFSEHCYLPISEEMSWGEAQSFCKANATTSDLVTIYSVYEDIHIRTMAKDLGDTAWIGLRDTLSEGSWVCNIRMGFFLKNPKSAKGRQDIQVCI